MDRIITPAHRIRGSLAMPGDKSISHRALMLASIAEGETKITHLAPGKDVYSTWRCLSQLGISIEKDGHVVLVKGKGLNGFRPPHEDLDVGNSGTTIRLLAGLLSAQPFESTLTGDTSIRRRPMIRVIEPLRLMGVQIQASDRGTAPIRISGGTVRPITYATPVPSAQIKSCVLLAGLKTSGNTTVREASLSRDHTERMLSCFGVKVNRDHLAVNITGPASLSHTTIDVPGDISSAAFFITAGTIADDAKLVLKEIGVNPTRTGLIEVLQGMGGDICIKNEHLVNEEPRAEIEIQSSRLKGSLIEGALIPRVIDEIPVIAVAATQAEGRTVIRDARELRVKETDRIQAVVRNLKAMGVQIQELDDGLIIPGSQKLRGGIVDSYGDHRIAMAFAVAGLSASGDTIIRNSECVDISFPGYFETLKCICHE